MPSGKEDLVKLSQASLSVSRIPLAELEERAVPEVAELVDLLQPVGEVTMSVLPLLRFTNSKLPLLIRESSVSVGVVSVVVSSEDELSGVSLQAANAAKLDVIINAMRSARSLFLRFLKEVAIITTLG